MSKAMKKIDYAGAVPPMPEHFLKTIEHTLKEAETMRLRKRAKLTASLAVALTAALLLAGIAYAAARSGLIGRIFTRSAPSSEAREMVRPVNQTATGERFAFTVNDYLIDGSDLYVDWTVQSLTDEDLMLVASPMQASLEMGGLSDPIAPGSLGGQGIRLSALKDGVLSGMNEGHLSQDYSGQPFEVRFQLALVRTSVPAEQAVWENLDSLGEVVEQIELSFPVEGGAPQGKRLTEPVSFNREDFALTVTEACFTGVNAQIKCELKWGAPELAGGDLMFQIWIDGQDSGMASMQDDSSVEFWSEGGYGGLPDEFTIVPGMVEYTDQGMRFTPLEGQQMTVRLS